MIPFYKIQIDDDIEGMDFIALVDVPAHLKGFEYFGKDNKPKEMFFDEERRIVTGVAIATDTPIYRNSPDIGEHYVVFSKSETFKIAQKMMQKGFFHNVNEMHDSNKKLDGVFLTESYFIDRARGVNEPKNFKDQNLKDGTWITSYYVKNDKVWDDIKKGKFFGFSVEGYFDKAPINIKNKTKQKTKQMSEKKKRLIDRLLDVFSADDEIVDESNFGSAMTVDGVEVVWDGEEVAVGTELRVVTEEGEVLAPDGEHAIEINGEIKVFVTEAGIVTDILNPVAEGTEEEMESVLTELLSAVNAKFSKQKELHDKEVSELKEEFKALSEKFNAFENATEEGKRKFNKTTTAKKESVASWKNHSK